MKKRIITLLLALGLCVGINAPAAAANETISVLLDRQLKVTYNGVAQGFSDVDGNVVYPIVFGGSTYLPVRAVSALTGLSISYDGATNTVAMTSGGTASQNTNPVYGASETIAVLLNRDLRITYNGQAQSFADANGAAVYPISYNGTTYLPVRAVSGLLDLPINYDIATKTVALGTGAAPETAAGDAKLSASWTEQEFILEGTKLKLDFAYQSLEGMGWTVDLSEYGKDDGYILNPDDKVSGTIGLSNSKYDDKFKFWIGFKNNGTAAATIKTCDVWTVNFARVHGTRLLESVPTVTIAGDLTWGSTKEQVKSILGEPKESYRSESLGYESYTYKTDDYGKYLKLTVYDQFGLSEIQLQKYK